MPTLTIGIPTLDRPQMLRKALESCLAQSRVHRVRIIVSDQGRSPGTAAVRRDHRKVRWLKSDAETSWENWRNVALACETEYFAWLQDDDIVMPCFADRALGAFDRHPEASAYCGVLHCSVAGHGRQVPWLGVWPLVPMDERSGAFRLVHGDLMVPVSYVETFAMSPAVAFRADAGWREMIGILPDDMAIYLERLYLVGAGRLGPIACDPTVVGCSLMHEGQHGRDLRGAGERGRQYRSLLRILDPIMDRIEDPGRWFAEVFGYAAGSFGERWLDDSMPHRDESPHLWRAREILLQMAGRPPDSPYRPLKLAAPEERD